MLDIQYTPDALKDLKAIGHVAAGKVLRKIEDYAESPSSFLNQVKKLKGTEIMRLRVGDYRVLFNEDGMIRPLA